MIMMAITHANIGRFMKNLGINCILLMNERFKPEPDNVENQN